MLVPRACPSPYATPDRSRFAAVGYLSPADLVLDGSVVYGEGVTYESQLIDASGYNSVMFVILLTGVTNYQIDYEWHYIDPKAKVNPAPNYQLTMPYTDFGVDEGPYAYTWGTVSRSIGPPGPGDTGWKEAGPLIGAFHMSFVVLTDLITPTAWAFFATVPTPAPSR